MEYSVCKFSAKGLRRTDMTEEDRIVLLGDGSALWYKHNVVIDFQSVNGGPFEDITVDLLIQADLAYRAKDSHLDYTDEPVPDRLYVRTEELKHIVDNRIALPIAEFVEVLQG